MTRYRRLAFALAALVCGSASSAQEHYVYRGEEVALEYDLRRIAIFGPAPAEVLDSVGLDSARGVRWPIAGWRLFDVPEEAQSQNGIRALLEELGASEVVRFVAPVFRGSDGGPVFPTNHLLVQFRHDVGDEDALGARANAGAGVVLDDEWGGLPNTYRVRSEAPDGLSVLTVANELATDPRVVFAEPDMAFTGSAAHIPNDPGFVNLWGLHNVGQLGGTPDVDVDAPAAWDVTFGDPSILIVVIDTGVQQDHPDLRMIPGVDVTSDGPGDGGPVNMFDNHGTPVAGCIGATIDNALGTVGIAPDCSCASARTFITSNNQGAWTTLTSWTVTSLDWAENAGARVTVNSNVYSFQTNAIAAKYAATRAAGMVHFAITGNTGSAGVAYPGNLASVNAIGALNRHGEIANFSSYGPETAFAAPGADIYTTDRTGSDGYSQGGYTTVFGTSFAAPYAAGVAALLLSTNPQLTAQEVEDALQAGAVDLGTPGQDNFFGNGFVNASRTLLGCEVATYCTSLPNSTGNAASIAAMGSNSIAENNLTLFATDAIPAHFGVFFYGGAAAQFPLGDGVQCLAAGASGVFRLNPPSLVDGTGVARRPLDFNQPPLDAGPGRVTMGSTWHFQFWYRDPFQPGGAGFNLTDGVRVVFCP